jgi:transposase
MRALEQETNIEVLREFAKYALQELLKTKEELALERQKKLQVEQLRLKYEDQLLVFRKMIFARGREKRADSSDRPRSTEEDFLLTHSQSLAPAPKPYAIKDLEIEEVIAEMTDLELEEESKIRGFEDPSSSDWKKMPGFFDESTQVHVIERKYVKKVIKRQKYESTREIESEESKKVIITANHPEQLIVGGSYTVDFAVSVIADKYISHMPLERQCKEMASLGLLKMQPKTLYNLCFIGSVHLEKVAEKIKNDILKAYRCLHLDESPWPINTKKEDDGYMWVLSNQAGSYYRFETTRSGVIRQDILCTNS